VRLDSMLMTRAEGPVDSDLSDLELVSRSRSGDLAAFETLYRRNIGRVYGVCLRMTSNAHQAEDCAQEAFIQAWRKLESFKGDAEFGTWLYRIAVNQVLTQLRKERRHSMRLVQAKEHEELKVEHVDVGLDRDLEQGIRQLPERARHIFVLHCVYGHSHQEVAEMLDIAVGTTKAQVHRARRLLHEFMGD